MYLWRLSFVIIIIAMLGAGSASAQARKDSRAGVVLGGGATYLAVPKGVDRQIGPTYFGGLFAVLPLTTMYKLQPEVQYERQESKVSGQTRRFEYVNVSLFVRMNLFKGIYINEGPAYHIPERATVGGVDVKGNTKDNFSITIGVGKRGAHAGFEARWDSYILATQKRLVPGDVPTRPRALSLVLSIF